MMSNALFARVAPTPAPQPSPGVKDRRSLEHAEESAAEKLPLATRIALIMGSSALLWAMCIVSAQPLFHR